MSQSLTVHLPRYDSRFFRATWVLTALDAGFWTAMKIRTRWLRDLASMVFSVYYLIAAEKADEKVRKVRGMITVDHMRVAWNKPTTPYLRFMQSILRPRFTRWPPRQVRIARPPQSDYKDPVSAWLYYDGPLADLDHHNGLVLDAPGGGFVAMDPRCNDDKLFAWAAKSGLPILSLDYRKAPEYPYPYALNECFDVYTTLVHTRGRCVGMSGKETPRIILSGDSAGGNLMVATTLMILEANSSQFDRFPGREGLPVPEGLVLCYPALDMNIGNWMSDEQMALIRDRRSRKMNKSVVRRKSLQYNDVVGPLQKLEEGDETPPGTEAAAASGDLPARNVRSPLPEYSHTGPRSLSQSHGSAGARSGRGSHHAESMGTRLATSSMISYFNDRVLTPEMMRAMIILYIGPRNRPDFTQDYLLSPVLAPEALLAAFPKTYFMTGERDPLVDDTLIFSGRLRRAREAEAGKDRRHDGVEGSGAGGPQPAGDGSEATEVMLIPGISHGFLQFPSVYPPAWRLMEQCAGWFRQLLTDAEHRRCREARARSRRGRAAARRSSFAESSEDDRPLEIGMTRLNRGRQGRMGSRETQDTSCSREAEEGRDGRAGREPRGAAKKPARGLKTSKSMLMSSSDDLLSRRMEGLVNALRGPGEDDE